MKTVAIDYETYLISEHQPIPKPVCLSWFDGKDTGLLVGEDIEQFLKNMLESDLIIAHNACFELLVTYKHFPNLRKLVWKSLDEKRFVCTKLTEKLDLNIRERRDPSVNLATLVKRYFQKDISETKSEGSWRMRYSELDGVPINEWPKEAVDYAIDDSIWAYKVYQRQKNLGHDVHPHVAADFALNWAGLLGFTVDHNRARLLQKEIFEILQPAYVNLNKNGMVVLKSKDKQGNFTKQVFTYTKKAKTIYDSEDQMLIEKQAPIIEKFLDNKDTYRAGLRESKLRELIASTIKEPELTEKKAISTSADSLKLYSEERPDIETFKNVYEIKHYTKIIAAFLEPLLKANPTIKTGYNVIVSSGRTSSHSSPFYPSFNMQQMPREVKNVTYDVRNCFVARRGYKIFSIDYAGLELASTANQLAQLLGWSKMRDAINAGDEPTDMHSNLAYTLRNMSKQFKECDYKEFVANKKKEGYAEYRKIAKVIGLGFPGGIGYEIIANQLKGQGISPKYAELQTFKYENNAKALIKEMGHPDGVRVHRTGFREYKVVYDETVELKQKLLLTYPCLGEFLRERHSDFKNGKTKKTKNQWGEWEDEDLYCYTTHGVSRDGASYTATCNGYLMQTASAVGAKAAMVNLQRKYIDDPRLNVLAFIHDEVVGEVKICDEMDDLVIDCAEIMVDTMMQTLPNVRIAVEADIKDNGWSKGDGSWIKTIWKNLDSDKLRIK